MCIRDRPKTYDEKGVKKFFSKPNVAELLDKGADALMSLAEWNEKNCEAAYRELIDREGIKSGELIHPSRLALTGKTVGPGLFEIMVVLGQDETVSRLRSADVYKRQEQRKLFLMWPKNMQKSPAEDMACSKNTRWMMRKG